MSSAGPAAATERRGVYYSDGGGVKSNNLNQKNQDNDNKSQSATATNNNDDFSFMSFINAIFYPRCKNIKTYLVVLSILLLVLLLILCFLQLRMSNNLISTIIILFTTLIATHLLMVSYQLNLNECS